MGTSSSKIIAKYLLQRIQTAILKAFNNPTTKTADEETKRKVKGMLLFCDPFTIIWA